jgi:hypothetical protein
MMRTMSDTEDTFDKAVQGGISNCWNRIFVKNITISGLLASYSPPQVCKPSFSAELGELQELIPYKVGSPIEYW